MMWEVMSYRELLELNPLICLLVLGCLELWYCDVGGDELRGAALLELVQPGRYQGHREGLQVRDLEQSFKVFGFLLLKGDER